MVRDTSRLVGSIDDLAQAIRKRAQKSLRHNLGFVALDECLNLQVAHRAMISLYGITEPNHWENCGTIERAWYSPEGMEVRLVEETTRAGMKAVYDDFFDYMRTRPRQ